MDILINVLNIQDIKVLEEAKIVFTTAGYFLYQSELSILFYFDFSYLNFLYFYLFLDIYLLASKAWMSIFQRVIQ